MSTLTLMMSRVLVVISVMAAMLMMPKPVFAGEKGAPKIVISQKDKAIKWSGMSRVARAAAQRAKMAGLSVAANTGWAVALTAGAIYDAAQHNVQGVMVLGGFATYNGIQAFRKWRAEKVMMEAQ
jgi:hypothetical protein